MKKNRDYQYNFSEILHKQMYDYEGRERKAKTIVAVLNDFFQSDFHSQSLLDVGCSTGIISNYLADHFGQVVGIDIDDSAINFAKNKFKKDNLTFIKNDSLRKKFSQKSFDVVICAHIYEHVPDAERLMAEIFRVLKPEGVCFFSAGNRMKIMEPHYNLPFLSVIPKPLANFYIRASGKSNLYYENHRSYWGLKKLVQNFECMDYTQRIIEEPEKFHVEYMIEPDSKKAMLAGWMVKYAYWLSPTYIWLLRKPQQ